MSKFMYVGPTVPGVAIRNTTYEEKPEPLAAAIRERPYLAGLCVPIKGLPAALAQINQQKGGIYNLYQRALGESAEIQKGAI